MESREYTTEEVRQKFLEAIWRTIRYWKTIRNPGGDRMEGCVFSILSMLDGCNGAMPAFVVAPAPHPSDRRYLQREGENYYPEAPHEAYCDIAGCLHELFHRVGREMEGKE